MAGQFQTCSDATPNQSSRFADNMQQLLGEDFDPDALFLEESWTLGIPAAALLKVLFGYFVQPYVVRMQSGAVSDEVAVEVTVAAPAAESVVVAVTPTTAG